MTIQEQSPQLRTATAQSMAAEIVEALTGDREALGAQRAPRNATAAGD